MISGQSKNTVPSVSRHLPGWVLIVLAGLLIIGTPASGQQPKVTKRVLILLTGQHGVPGCVLAEEGMRASLDQSTDFKIEYFIEYMDRYRFNDVSYQKDLLNLYRTKYTDKKIDLFIVNGYHALEFAVTHGDEIFPQTPVVFSRIYETQLKRIKLDQRFTGCLLQLDYLRILNTALSNHPDTQNVAIIVGTSANGRMLESQIRPTYAPYANKYDFIFLAFVFNGNNRFVSIFPVFY